MQGKLLIIGSIVIVVLIIVFVLIHLIKKSKVKFYKNQVKQLEIKRNLIASTPVLLELSKVEAIIKNETMEEKYNSWKEQFENIKNNKLATIDDMIIDLDIFVDKKDYKSCITRIAKTELELCKIEEEANSLLDEIKDITSSDEKYRTMVTKLKTKYRNLNKEFIDHKQLYDSMQEGITLQLENIEKRFLEFEVAMEKNEYSEVVHIVKALDTMINHIEVIIKEVPDILLMIQQVIPSRVKEIEYSSKEMIDQGYSLEYLNIDYNIDEIKKNCESILDKVRVLNLENCMFDLTTMLEYLDSLFIDFEKERLSKKVFEEMNKDFSKKITNSNKLVGDVYLQLDDIKKMYDLKEEDIEIINKVNKDLVVINDDYKKLLSRAEAKTSPYSVLHKDIEFLANRLRDLDEELDKSLKSLGNMYEDEVRAREQLDEIQRFLKLCKMKMRTYKLPIITDNYFVQLAEANEAIFEVINELEKKPIVIKTLNIRVDTARDLVLKLYNTTNDMVRTAELTERAVIYGNRYRESYAEVDSGIREAEQKFYKGKYKEAFDTVIKAISVVEEDIYDRMMKASNN